MENRIRSYVSRNKMHMVADKHKQRIHKIERVASYNLNYPIFQETLILPLLQETLVATSPYIRRSSPHIQKTPRSSQKHKHREKVGDDSKSFLEFRNNSTEALCI